jgi:DNA (cytosine-5)-methyltransferase 1
VSIAERTVAALNEGASLAALGISEERALELREDVTTIGTYLGRIREELTKNEEYVRGLVAAERCRVWTVVIAGNEPEGDVAALTRGGYAYADIDRLLTATEANVVSELKKIPEKLGILGTVLDARIVHIDMVAALALCRTFGSPALHDAMQLRGMTTNSDDTATDRVVGSELGLLLRGESLGTRKRGPKPGSNTVAAFKNIAEIARQNDILCNEAIGNALTSTGLIDGFETEKDLGKGLTRRTDIYCEKEGEPIRLEVMWRSKAGRADIANYVLGKLANYGKATGFLD